MRRCVEAVLHGSMIKLELGGRWTVCSRILLPDAPYVRSHGIGGDVHPGCGLGSCKSCRVQAESLPLAVAELSRDELTVTVNGGSQFLIVNGLAKSNLPDQFQGLAYVF